MDVDALLIQTGRVVNIAIIKVLQYYWQYFLGIASILPSANTFLNLVLIAVLQYFFTQVILQYKWQ